MKGVKETDKKKSTVKGNNKQNTIGISDSTSDVCIQSLQKKSS